MVTREATVNWEGGDEVLRNACFKKKKKLTRALPTETIAKIVTLTNMAR